MSSEPLARLIAGAAEWGVPLSDESLKRFAHFAAKLEEVNQQMNLTRVPPEEYETLHFLDSLALLTLHKPAPGARLLDVGTGAGFPGLPLAFVCPELKVTLLDGTKKRLNFLDEAISELGLTNVTTVQGRAEELVNNKAHKLKYDIVVARAVAKLSVLATWLLPLTAPGGIVVAYKSMEVDEEISDAIVLIERSGATLEQVARVTLPGTDIVRKLVVLRKNATRNAPKKVTGKREKTRSKKVKDEE